MLLEFIKLYQQNALEGVFIFIIYRNYTLALIVVEIRITNTEITH